MKIERNGSLIKMTNFNGSYTTSGSMECNLLFSILEKLEEIKCCIIDVETATDRANKEVK